MILTLLSENGEVPSKDWLRQKDSFGNQIGTWAKIISDTEVLCIVCDSKTNFNKGFENISQHVTTRKHF